MEFSSSTLVAAAENIAKNVSNSQKTTLRHFHVQTEPKAEIKPREIAAIRKTLNVSQAVFAAYLGVRPSSVMSWEYGTRHPSGAVRKLLAIAKKNPKILLEVA